MCSPEYSSEERQICRRSTNSAEDTTSEKPTPELIPEGGLRAWLVVLGSFSALFSTWGIVNSYGVFQEEYATHQLKNSSSSTISLIGAIQLFFLYGLGPIVGRIFDVVGSRILYPVGSLVVVLSLFMVSLCQDNKTYQFFLAHGVLFGLGSALLFTPSLAIIGHWFQRKRSLVIAIVASGSSAGGVVYPIIFKTLIGKTGFPWAVRIMAFVTMGFLTLSCLCVRTNLPLSGTLSLRQAVDFRGFREKEYCLVTLAAFLLFYASFIPYFYIELYADHHNVSPNVKAYLVPILNASGSLRPILGFIADLIGPLNLMIPCVFLTVIILFGIWLPATGPVPIIIFTALYGLLSGATLALLPAYVGEISTRDTFGGRLGAIYLFVAVASLVGTPTAGAFADGGKEPMFSALISFTGALMIGGGITLLVARLLHSRQLQIVI